jgi:polygalacturonase
VPDGLTDARDAIKAAITACNKAGGGRVVVQGPGTYYVAGPIHMKANVDLHVAAGATLTFSSTASDFLKEGLTLTRFEGTEVCRARFWTGGCTR